MSGTFPTAPAPSSVTPRSLQPTQVSLSHSLKRQVRSRGIQRWGFKLSYVNKTRSEMARLIAFAVAQRGQYGTFTFVPAVIGKRQAGSGNPLIRTTTAGGRTIPVSGASAGATLALAGDYVKFAGHSKVYLLTADAVANGSGQADFTIEPALYAGVTAGEAVILDNVPFTVAFAADLHETPIAPPLRYTWECELVEVLP